LLRAGWYTGGLRRVDLTGNAVGEVTGGGVVVTVE
jgi:hypothetical protein